MSMTRLEAAQKHFEQPPVLRGDVYCSPWCGFKCTHAAFVRATEEADTLAELLGKGWWPKVWENCGWHYQAVRGVVQVRPGIRGDERSGDWVVVDYSCWIQTSPQYIELHHPTPQIAIHMAMMKMKAAFDQLRDSFTDTYAIGQGMGLVP